MDDQAEEMPEFVHRAGEWWRQFLDNTEDWRTELGIPFQGAKAAGQSLVAGTRVLLCDACRGLAVAWKAVYTGKTVLDRLESAAVALFGAGVAAVAVAVPLAYAWPHIAPYTPILVSVGGGAWMVAAWLVAPRAPQKQPEKPSPQVPAGPSTADLIDRDRRALYNLLDKATARRNGVHLDELFTLTSADPLFGGVPRANLVPLLKAFGVDYKRSLSVDGISGRSGVSRAHVETLLQGLPSGSSPPPDSVDSRTAESGPDLQESEALSADSRAILDVLSGPSRTPADH
jgi:hypothetical protein